MFILSIHLISFCVFPVYAQFHPAYSMNMHSKNIKKIYLSFCIWQKAQIHSVYS
jgi:hypothetical protein